MLRLPYPSLRRYLPHPGGWETRFMTLYGFILKAPPKMLNGDIAGAGSPEKQRPQVAIGASILVASS